MSNRIANRCYIIDSASGAGTPLPWPDGGMKIHTVSFFASDSSGKFELTYYADTTNTAILIASPNTLPSTIDLHFGEPHWFEKLCVKTVTNGTGFLYFS